MGSVDVLSGAGARKKVVQRGGSKGMQVRRLESLEKGGHRTKVPLLNSVNSLNLNQDSIARDHPNTGLYFEDH